MTPEQRDAEELGLTSFSCPRCGENRIDWLVWKEGDGGVDCASCGYAYVPAGELGVDEPACPCGDPNCPSPGDCDVMRQSEEDSEP